MIPALEGLLSASRCSLAGFTLTGAIPLEPRIVRLLELVGDVEFLTLNWHLKVMAYQAMDKAYHDVETLISALVERFVVKLPLENGQSIQGVSERPGPAPGPGTQGVLLPRLRSLVLSMNYMGRMKRPHHARVTFVNERFVEMVRSRSGNLLLPAGVDSVVHEHPIVEGVDIRRRGGCDHLSLVKIMFESLSDWSAVSSDVMRDLVEMENSGCLVDISDHGETIYSFESDFCLTIIFGRWVYI
jgi:hypothetical protein